MMPRVVWIMQFTDGVNLLGKERDYMKIKEINTYFVRPRWGFVEIITDQGLSGWGEAVLEGHAGTVLACVHEMEDYLIGADPAHIEDIWTVLYRAGFYRGGGVMMSAISGIDQALWDIKGKYFNAPVHELMGGSCRNKMRVYSWIGGDRPTDVGAAAREKMEAGFTAVKMNATEELQFIDSYDKIDAVLERVDAIRLSCGKDLALPLISTAGCTGPWLKSWLRSWRLTTPCSSRSRCSARTWNASARLQLPARFPLPQERGCIPNGISSACSRWAAWISSSLTCPMQGASQR